VIELLGIGAGNREGGWLLRRVCARFRPGELAVVVSRDPAERLALLDAVSARLLPLEGRVWVSRVPVMRSTLGRIRALVAEADIRRAPVAGRSLLWNVLTGGRGGPRGLRRLLRLPGKSEREAALRALQRVGLGGRALELAAGLDPVERAHLALACVLARRPEYLVVREVDRGLAPSDAAAVLTTARTLAHADRLAVLASVTDAALGLEAADRIVRIADGLLVFDGPAAGFAAAAEGRRPEGAGRS
jgi:ABC-type phosphate/phosphonate transport system ATPase subunit